MSRGSERDSWKLWPRYIYLRICDKVTDQWIRYPESVTKLSRIHSIWNLSPWFLEFVNTVYLEFVTKVSRTHGICFYVVWNLRPQCLKFVARVSGICDHGIKNLESGICDNVIWHPRNQKFVTILFRICINGIWNSGLKSSGNLDAGQCWRCDRTYHMWLDLVTEWGKRSATQELQHIKTSW